MKLILLSLILTLIPIQAFGISFPSHVDVGNVTPDMAAEHWKWFINIGVEQGHPFQDRTGAFTQLHNQDTYENIFFLSGGYYDDGHLMQRNVTVQYGRPILIAAHMAGYGYFHPNVASQLFTDKSEIKEGLCTLACPHNITNMEILIDGIEHKPTHIKDSGLFDANYNTNTPFFEGYHHDNAYSQSGWAETVVDGYYVLINILPVGEHTVHWEQTSSHYNDNITYNVSVK
jgi:hypothetical protein